MLDLNLALFEIFSFSPLSLMALRQFCNRFLQYFPNLNTSKIVKLRFNSLIFFLDLSKISVKYFQFNCWAQVCKEGKVLKGKLCLLYLQTL